MVDNIRRESPDAVMTTGQTKTYTSLIMHGQDRNIHGKVFGGYLMREAFDISYLTVLKKSLGISPELLRVD
jgi:acyl-coenzyme A thioesterase 9